MPELAKFGLDIQTMRELLNTLGRKAAAGAVLESGQEHHDVIAELPIVLKDADLRRHRAFFGGAISLFPQVNRRTRNLGTTLRPALGTSAGNRRWKP
ncbi:DUF4262 domain-containing protein [Streptomyces sp. NPDC058239]|uniref:DUF4262 domain-containing protein n=1 Tax=Streptomyces sp. NPDC058239 TaxID=3346395 RepID=UPI0036E950C3